LYSDKPKQEIYIEEGPSFHSSKPESNSQHNGRPPRPPSSSSMTASTKALVLEEIKEDE